MWRPTSKVSRAVRSPSPAPPTRGSARANSARLPRIAASAFGELEIGEPPILVSTQAHELPWGIRCLPQRGDSLFLLRARPHQIVGRMTSPGRGLACRRGYEPCPRRGAVIKYELDPADGVQCESCHGPGSNYRKRSVMSDRKKAVAMGMVLPTEAVCVACHNDESPSWDGAAGFDYAEAKKRIAHPTPASVRGRIAEIEKEQKEK